MKNLFILILILGIVAYIAIGTMSQDDTIRIETISPAAVSTIEAVPVAPSGAGEDDSYRARCMGTLDGLTHPDCLDQITIGERECAVLVETVGNIPRYELVDCETWQPLE